MKRTKFYGIAIIFYCFLLLSIEVVIAQNVQLLDTKIVASFTTPCNSPAELSWDGKYLWLGDNDEKILGTASSPLFRRLLHHILSTM